MTLISAFIFLSLTSFAQEKVTATLYGLKSKSDAVLYTSVFEAKAVGSLVESQVVYKDAQGQVALTEKGQLNGDQILKYEMDRTQTKEKGDFYVKNGRIFFTYEGPDGKKKTNDEKVKGSLLSTANFNAFVQSHWADIEIGKGVEVRFAVWDRLETVGFTLQRTGTAEKDGKKLLEMRMKPTSFVIAAIVDPIYFWYSMDDRKLRTMKGRVAPKIQENGKWKDLDARVEYSHQP
jgi:hypothetical protein